LPIKVRSLSARVFSGILYVILDILRLFVEFINPTQGEYL